MAADPHSRRTPTALPETALLTAAAFAAFLLLRQGSSHGYDVYTLLRHLDGTHSYPQHPAYFPLARLLHALIAPLGASAHDTLSLLSALGTALGLGALHRTALLLAPGDRNAARWTVLIAATLPAVVHFATVVELHGAFFAPAALAWWACARLLARPTPSRAALLGALSGAATLVHASGQVLPGLFLLWLWWQGRTRGDARRLVRLGLLAAVAHAAVWAMGFTLLRQLWPPLHDDHPAAFLWRLWRESPVLPLLGHSFWWEWLRPFAPMSFAALLGLLFRPARPLSALILLAAAGYTVLCAIMLYSGNVEHGAYLLPLALPLGHLAAHALPAALRLPLLLGAIAVNGWLLTHAERPPADLAFGRAVLAEQAERPLRLLVGDFDELDGVARLDPAIECFQAHIVLEQLRRLRETTAEQVVGWFLLQTGLPGSRLVVTDTAVATLREALPAFAAAWDGGLPGLLRTRVERVALQGWAVSRP